MHNIMFNGKPTAFHKEMKEKEIARMKLEGKSGVVKVDEKLAELRAKIQHQQPEQTTTASSKPSHPKVMHNALKQPKINIIE